MKLKITILIVLLSISFNRVPYAGQLDNFEKRGTERSSEKKSKSSSDTHSKSSGSSSSCIGGLFEFTAKVVFIAAATGVSYAAKNSMARTGTKIESDFIKENPPRLREKGEASLPYARFDYGYQNVQGDIYANDYRLELGTGAFGIQARTTDYFEKTPKDKLSLSYIHGLLRLSFGDYFEIDPGIGKIKLEGNDANNGFSFTLPVLIHPSKNFGFECRPAWSLINGNSIRDIDFCVLAGTDYVSLKAGYRVIKTGDEELKGPYIGLSIRY